MSCLLALCTGFLHRLHTLGLYEGDVESCDGTSSSASGVVFADVFLLLFLLRVFANVFLLVFSLMCFCWCDFTNVLLLMCFLFVCVCFLLMLVWFRY